MLLALLLAAASPASVLAEGFAYQRGLVCEGDKLWIDQEETTCADPIGGVELWVRDSNGNETYTTTNERGEFAFPEPFPLDGRDYSITIVAIGYEMGVVIERVQTERAPRPATQVQVVFSLPRPELRQDDGDRPVLLCGHGVRYLLHSGEKDNTCASGTRSRRCWSGMNTEAYAEANCDQGCTSTGGPGSCCRMGTAGCELRKLLDPRKP